VNVEHGNEMWKMWHERGTGKVSESPTHIPPCVREVMGSIPVGNSDIFFVPRSCHIFHISVLYKWIRYVNNPNVANVFIKLNSSRFIWNAAQINEKLKRPEFDSAFVKISKRGTLTPFFQTFFRCYDLIPSHGKEYIFRKALRPKILENIF